jgi:hypothetical protein
MAVYGVYKVKNKVVRNERKNCTVCYTSEMSKNNTVSVLLSRLLTVV